MSSFQKRARPSSTSVLGTKISATTSILHVSSGISSLDDILGKSYKYLVLTKTRVYHVKNQLTYCHLIILDGGLPLGSLCLIGIYRNMFAIYINKNVIMKFVLFTEEDEYGSFARTITKYFLAEGIHKQNYVFAASMNENPWDLVRLLKFTFCLPIQL